MIELDLTTIDWSLLRKQKTANAAGYNVEIHFVDRKSEKETLLEEFDKLINRAKLLGIDLQDEGYK